MCDGKVGHEISAASPPVPICAGPISWSSAKSRWFKTTRGAFYTSRYIPDSPTTATIPAIEMAIAARGTRNEFAICIGDLAMIELSDDEAWLIRKINTNNGEVTIYGDITARKINRLIPEYVTQTTKREDTYTFTLTDKGKKVASAFRDKSAKD